MSLLLAVLILAGVDTRLTAGREAGIILAVAKRYGLTPQETRLLCSIRRVENGGPGLEFGVGSDRENHPARRLAHIPEASLRLQAEWAAGTIVRRYRGATLEQFAARWCPPDTITWIRNVTYYMTATQAQLEGRP